MAKTDKQEHYYLYEIAKITGEDEREILSMAEKGLTFSMYIPYVGLELHQCKKHIEDKINGHEVFDVEVIKQEYNEYTHETLDLFSSTPVSFARGKTEIEPDFHVPGWHRAIVLGRDKIYATKDNIFVTADNIAAYGKLDKAFDAAFKKRQKQKPGPKQNKHGRLKDIILGRLNSGKISVEELLKQNQESVAADKELNTISTNRITIMKAVKEAAQDFKELGQN